MDEEPIAPISVNKYDQFQLKAAMDDTIISLLDEQKFEQDNGHTDIKIGISLL